MEAFKRFGRMLAAQNFDDHRVQLIIPQSRRFEHLKRKLAWNNAFGRWRCRRPPGSRQTQVSAGLCHLFIDPAQIFAERAVSGVSNSIDQMGLSAFQQSKLVPELPERVLTMRLALGQLSRPLVCRCTQISSSAS